MRGKRSAPPWRRRGERGNKRKGCRKTAKRFRQSFLRADACGFGFVQIVCFFVLPDGTREDPQAGPSLDFPGPKGAFPAFGIHPSTCIFEFSEALLNEVRLVLFGDKRVYRQTARRITGAITKMSGSEPEWLAQRQRCSLPVLDLTALPWQGMLRWVLDLCPSCTLSPQAAFPGYRQELDLNRNPHYRTK